MKKNKVLVINQGHSAGNLGDTAIRESMDVLFEDLGKERLFGFFSNPVFGKNNKSLPMINYFDQKEKAKKNKTQKNVKLKGFLRFFYWKRKNQSYIKNLFETNDFSKIIIGGGQLMNSMPKKYKFPHTFCIAFYWWVRLTTKFSDADIFLMGVGAEGNFNKIEKFLYKKALSKVKKIWVRDYFSKEVIENELGFEAEVIPDVAFYKTITNSKNLTFENKKTALVGIYDFEAYNFKYNHRNFSLEEYQSEWLGYIKDLKNKNYEVNLFYTTESDAKESRRFANFLKKESISIPLLKINSLEDLTNFYKKSDIVISGRMHGLLLAAKYNCQIVPYVLSQKIKSFIEMYDLSLDGIAKLKNQIYNSIKRSGNF